MARRGSVRIDTTVSDDFRFREPTGEQQVMSGQAAFERTAVVTLLARGLAVIGENVPGLRPP